jgi:transposase
VALESTGVYWKPIYAILEGALEIVVANAQHIKKVPGRKTDIEERDGRVSRLYTFIDQKLFQ